MTEPTPQSPATPETSTERLERIHHRWKEESRRNLRKWWGVDSPLGNTESMAFLMALFLGVLCISPDSALWPGLKDTEEAALIHQVDGRFPATVLILLALVNGLLLDLVLTDQTAGSKPLRPSVRGLRFLISIIPPLGIMVPALWYRLLRDRRTWLEAPETSRSLIHRNPFASMLVGQFQSFIQTHVASFGRRLMASQWTMVWVLISNFVLSASISYWLVNPSQMTRGRFALIVGYSAAAHVIAFLGASHFFLGSIRTQLSSGGRFLFLALPIFWLVPLPLLSILGLLLLFFVRTPSDEETLVATAHGGRDSVGQLKIWRDLERFLRSRRPSLPPGRRRRLGNLGSPISPSKEQRHLLWLYKGKTSCILFEAIFLVRVLGALEQRIPSAAAVAQGVVQVAALAALAVGSIALSLQLVVVLSRMLYAENCLRFLDDQPYAFYFGVTQLVFFMGIYVGDSLEQGNAEQVAGVFLVAGVLGIIAPFAKMVLPIPERVHYSPAEDLLWMFVFVSMATVGLSPRNEPEEIKVWMHFLENVAWLFTVMSVLFGSALVGWLLRPFEVRQIFRLEIPRRRRYLLALLAFTAIAPLGGLWVPFWIYGHSLMASRE